MVNAPSNITAFHDLLVEEPRLTGLAPRSRRDALDRVRADDRRARERGTSRRCGRWTRPVSVRPASWPGPSLAHFAPDLRRRRHPADALRPGERWSSDGDAGSVGLWALPERGEAERIARHPGRHLRVHRRRKDTGTVAYTADLLPGATTCRNPRPTCCRNADAPRSTRSCTRRTPTRAGGVDLGPDEPHTFVLRAGRRHRSTPAAKASRAGGDMALSPDGALVAYTRAATGSAPDTNVVVIADAATGVERRTFSRPGHQYLPPGLHRRRLAADLPAPAGGDLRRRSGGSPSSRSTRSRARRPISCRSSTTGRGRGGRSPRRFPGTPRCGSPGTNGATARSSAATRRARSPA